MEILVLYDVLILSIHKLFKMSSNLLGFSFYILNVSFDVSDSYWTIDQKKEEKKIHVYTNIYVHTHIETGVPRRIFFLYHAYHL